MGGIAMGRTGINLRTDFDAAQLRLPASHSRDANQARRLPSIAAIYDGVNRNDAAMVGGKSRLSNDLPACKRRNLKQGISRLQEN